MLNAITHSLLPSSKNSVFSATGVGPCHTSKRQCMNPTIRSAPEDRQAASQAGKLTAVRQHSRSESHGSRLPWSSPHPQASDVAQRPTRLPAGYTAPLITLGTLHRHQDVLSQYMMSTARW